MMCLSLYCSQAFTGVALGTGASAASFIKIPFSVIFGAASGFLVGYLLAVYFEENSYPR